MKQINLKIVQRLPYRAEDFILHSGILPEFRRCVAAFKRREFSLVLIEGEARSGKTHLAMRLVDEADAHRRPVNLVDGHTLDQLLPGFEPQRGHAVVIDDAHIYLSKLRPGLSGPFVTFVESLRRADGVLVLLSGIPRREFQFDEHVASRIAAAAGDPLTAPLPEEMAALINRMAVQRGLKLPARRLGVLSRDLARDPAVIEQALAQLNIA